MAAKFRYSYSNSGAVNAVFTLAQERGIYADYGLDVDLVEYPKTSDALNATIRREVDAATCPGVNILNEAKAGGDPLIVMNLEDDNVFGVIAARHIKEPKDLKGTTVGTFGLGDQNQVVLRRALVIFGLDPDKDVQYRMDFKDRAALLAAVDRGEVSAMCMTVPTPIMARAMGLPILLDFRDLRERYQCGAIVTTRRYAEEQPDVLEQFLAASLKGAALFASDVEASLPHLRKASKLNDDDVLRKVHVLFAEAVTRPTPSEQSLQAVANDLEAALGKPLNVNVGSLIDPSYLYAAMSRSEKLGSASR